MVQVSHARAAVVDGLLPINSDDGYYHADCPWLPCICRRPPRNSSARVDQVQQRTTTALDDKLWALHKFRQTWPSLPHGLRNRKPSLPRTSEPNAKLPSGSKIKFKCKFNLQQTDVTWWNVRPKFTHHSS